MSHDNDRVVVTGLGATTPLGGDVASTWAGMLAGRSGIRAIEDEWAAGLPVRIAGRLKVEPSEVLDRVRARRMDRCEQVALIAAREAWADAGGPEVDPERLAVVIGTGTGGALTMLGQDDVLEASGVRKVSPHTVPMLMANGPAAWVSIELGARAGAHTPVSACASGAEAIAMGLDLIRLGRADVVVAGGAEACICPLPLAGFAQARAHSTRNDEPELASRPFDVGRDGFVIGEGSVVVVLERAGFAAPGRPGRTPRSPGRRSPRTRTTSPRPRPRARSARCAGRWPRRAWSRATSPTSTPTPPRPRRAIGSRPSRWPRRSGSTRPSPRPSR